MPIKKITKQFSCPSFYRLEVSAMCDIT